MKKAKTSIVATLQKLYRKSLQQQTAPADEQQKTASSLSRKQFISTLAIAAPSLLIPGYVKSGIGTINGFLPKTKVAIIGGGIAGLNACNHLSKSPGLEITIYEASKRTGGRIFTAKKVMDDELTTELGAEFIDSDHEDMLGLVKQYKLQTYDCGCDVAVNQLKEHLFFFGGQPRSQKEIDTEFRKMIPRLQKDKHSLENETPAAKDLDKLSLKAYLSKFNLKKWFNDLLYWAFTAEFGLEADELNCLLFIDMVGIKEGEEFEIFGSSDERFKIIGGNQLLIDAMTLEMKDKIKYEYKLTSITHSGDKTLLQFGNGETAEADYVLVTIPFTMLREVKINLKSPMPESKKYMIENMVYGTNSKYFIGMNKRIWRGHKSSGYLINETIQNGWDNSQLQNSNKGPAGFTVFLGGKQGANLTDNDAQRNKFLDVLETVFKGAKNEYNDKHALFNWSKQAHTLGSYACLRVGQWFKFNSKEMMAPVDNIYFAGEHCSENSQGFMNGGAETGRVAAENILSTIKEATGRLS